MCDSCVVAEEATDQREFMPNQSSSASLQGIRYESNLGTSFFFSTVNTEMDQTISLWY